jgi:hypothetical protein
MKPDYQRRDENSGNVVERTWHISEGAQLWHTTGEGRTLPTEAYWYLYITATGGGGFSIQVSEGMARHIIAGLAKNVRARFRQLPPSPTF